MRCERRPCGRRRCGRRRCGRGPCGGAAVAAGARNGRREAGYVTAELAVGFTALTAVAGALLATALAVAADIRCVDAAREGARAAARGDPVPVVVAAARRAAPAGARVAVSSGGGLVRVSVSSAVAGPLPLRVGAEAAAGVEQPPGPGGPPPRGGEGAP